MAQKPAIQEWQILKKIIVIIIFVWLNFVTCTDRDKMP